MPVVGFGDQSARWLPRTLQVLAAQSDLSRKVLVVAVVNRPATRRPDDTAERIAAARSRGNGSPGAPALAVCDVAFTARPRIGEARQLALDAVRATGVNIDNVAIVLMDDDLVAAPRGLVAGLADSLESRSDVVVGPVLFDDTDAPMCLFVELYVSDLTRALLADRLVGALGASGPRPARLGSAGGEEGEEDARPFEALVLSGNLAVRMPVLTGAGGFRDLNEITWLLGDTVAAGGSVSNGSAATFGGYGRLGLPPALRTLLDRAVRMSSRRALAAWMAGRHPTVAQWQACRLRSRHVDPVRIQGSLPEAPRPVRMMSLAARRALLDQLAAAIATTLGHLEPSLDLAAWALDQVGLDPSTIRLDPARAPGAPWNVRISHPGGVLDVVDALQRFELDGSRLGVHVTGPHAAAAWVAQAGP